MHKDFILAALKQAWLGRGHCAPNPSVGAVAVHRGEIIAQAWHAGAGSAHAEQLVLQQIPKGLSDLILYVTLEPCNHWGKTPPCIQGIINYGVSQVVYAFSDPNPLVAVNNTPQQLRDAGIAVIHYPLEEVDRFYQSYDYWTRTKKPWVTVKLAQSLDGKIAKQEQRVHLSNAECAEFTHLNRLYTDVILTTAKTIRVDDPLLNARVNGEEQGKILAILDRSLSLSNDAKVFSTAKHCHIYHDEQNRVANPHAKCSYHAVPSKEGLLDLSFIIEHLGNLGFHDVWVEAGGQLFSELQQQCLAQRTYSYVVPTTLGDKAISGFNKELLFNEKFNISWQIKADNVIACLELQESVCLPE